MIIARPFTGGRAHVTRIRAGGTIETLARNGGSGVPPGRGSVFTRQPSAEALGYCRMPLRGHFAESYALLADECVRRHVFFIIAKYAKNETVNPTNHE